MNDLHKLWYLKYFILIEFADRKSDMALTGVMPVSTLDLHNVLSIPPPPPFNSSMIRAYLCRHSNVRLQADIYTKRSE